MSQALRAVAHDVGALLWLPTAMAAVSVPVALAFGEPHAVRPLLLTGAASAALAAGLVRCFRHARTTARWPAVEVVALGWLLVGLFAAVVLWWVAAAGDGRHPADTAFLDPTNALFEGLSGITSTGLTVVGGREAELSATVQWWRSLLQWVGAVGVVLFAFGFAHAASGVRTLYEAEGRVDDLGPGVRVTVLRTWAVYLGLTVATVVALLFTEHSPWEALNHGITAISTGGFSITGDSIAGYGVATKVVVAVAMAVGAVSFVAHHVVFVQGDVRRWGRLTPVRAQLAALVGGGVLVVALQSRSEVALVDQVFQWVSASATAGLSTAPDLHAWTTPVLLVTIVAMAIGAPSGSTGGGAKLDRAAWLVKAALARARGRRIVWDGEEVSPSVRREAVGHAAAVVGLWAATILVGSVALAALTDAPLRDVAFDVTSALSNVGLDAGVAGPDLGGPAKLVLAALMYLGRLELLVALRFVSQHEHAT